MKAHYHQTGKAPLELHVVKDHKNGTVDLAREASGPAVITECPVVSLKEASPGTCTLVESDDPKKAAKAAAKALRVKATEAAKVNVEAAKAAKAAEGKPNHAELLKLAEEAAAVAQQADKDADEAEAALK